MSLPSTNSTFTIDDLEERIVEIQHALNVSLNDTKKLREELDSTRLDLKNERNQNQLLREQEQTLPNESSENEAILPRLQCQFPECHRTLETKTELNQMVQKLTLDIQNKKNQISNLSRDLSTMEKQKTEMERTYSKQNTKISTLTKKLRQVENEKQDSEDIVRTLLVETDSYDESLSQTGDVSSDLKNQLQHLRIMIAAAKEQYDHRLIGVTSIQRDETEMNTDRRLTAQIQSESIIETRRGAYINKIKDTIATLEDHLKIIRSARIGDELQNICSVLDVQIPNVNREQARDLHYMET